MNRIRPAQNRWNFRVQWSWLLLIALASASWNSRPARAAFTTDPAGFIPYWIAIGGIPTIKGSRTDILNHDYLPDEKDLHPAAGETVTIQGTAHTWQPVSADQGSPVVYGSNIFGEADEVMMYLVAYVQVDHPSPGASLYWGSDDSGKVYVNGAEVGHYSLDRTCEPDLDVAENLPLHKGLNTIILKIVNMQGPYAGCARLVDGRGMVMKNLPLKLAPEGKSVPAGVAWEPVRTLQTDPGHPVWRAIRASQIGYLTHGSKFAIASFRSGQPFEGIRLINARTRHPAMSIPGSGGSIKSTGSWPDLKAHISRIDFSSFHTPGRYYLASSDGSIQSQPFNIGDHVFTGVARAAMRAFYFDRFGQKLMPRYAGQWAAPAYHDPRSAARAQTYRYDGGGVLHLGDRVLDPRPVDTRGGWYNGVTPNQYTRNECTAHNALLLTYDMNRGRLIDRELNIPESGDGVPDLVDEAAVCSRYLLNIQRPDGAVPDRVLRPAEADGGLTKVSESCSGATLCAAGSLAWAGSVWREGGWNPAFAARLIQAAEKSWNYMQKHTGRWPRQADGWPRDIGSLDGTYGDETGWRMLAAAALFRATGKPEYKDLVEDYLDGLSSVRIGGNSLQLQTCHNYALGHGAHPTVVAAFGKKLSADAAAVRAAVGPDSRVYPYGAGCPDAYPWGSNGIAARQGAELAWWAWRFAPPSQYASYRQASEEYLQYLLGRNPSGWCYVTSLQSIGPEHSLRAMDLFLNQGDHWAPQDGDPAHVGCFPGFLVAGPMDGVDQFPEDQNEAAADEQRGGASITYQCQLVCLATFCANTPTQAGKQQEINQR